MTFAPLLVLVQLSALTLALSRTDADPSTGRPLACERCPPGTYLRQGCTTTRKSQCAPCPGGSFTALWNYIPKCLRCGVCGHNQVEKRACAPDADCTCECKDGYYYKESYDTCVAHSKCSAGEGVVAQGSPHNDTVCQVCPSGSFSDIASAHHKCTAHRSCDAAGLGLLLRGHAWHDTVCARCDDLRDGADYLREVLPAFFLHQNINVRRLHRILQRLPGNRATECLGRHRSPSEQIEGWAASATASQIRQLPTVLNKAGVDHAGDKLHSKLQRIDASLHKLCSLGNQVEMNVL